MKLIDALKIDQKPVITIFVNTYNHEKYIEDCLNSILRQKVDVPCEIILWDDCSTDDTIKIIDKLIPNFNNVKKIYEEDNLYSKGKKQERFFNLHSDFKGKVFFLIEGDDYWEGDENRFQKMATTLLDDASLSMCFSDTYRYDVSDEQNTKFLLLDQLKSKISISDLCRTNYSYIQVGASCFRNIKISFPKEITLQKNTDMWFPYLWGTYGPAQYLSDCGHLVYRFTREGVWSSIDDQQKTINRLIYACQLTSHMLKENNIEGVLFNAWRFMPIIENNPYFKFK
jgi:glycosyltransferase involved in cell wall biosynthesis